MASIGDQLKTPESGWQRIDDYNMNIKYVGEWMTMSGTNYYNGSVHYLPTNINDASVNFYFYGSKIRIIGRMNTNCGSVIIKIDETEYTFNEKGSSKYQALVFEKLDLEKKVHSVKIYKTTSYMCYFDAFDIDEDGHMVYEADDGKLYHDVTPIMTSDTESNGYKASASTVYTSNTYTYSPFLAFNGTNTGEKDCWATSNQNQLGYLELKFPQKQAISNFIIVSRNYDEYTTPKKFVIYGSNNGVDYIQLKSFENQIFAINETKFYDLGRVYKYQYYKLEIIETNATILSNGQLYTTIGELRYLLTVENIPFLIKDKSASKFYGYDEDNNSLVEVADISILETAPDTCINESDLNNVKELIDLTDDNVLLLSNKNFKLTVDGLKSSQEMIATLEPLNMRAYDVIHNITGDYVIENNGVIKLLFSFDKGTTWKTYDVNNSEWNDVNVDIPIRLYENFSDTDKTNWNTARDTILSDGISVQNLGNVDFQSVKANKLMFAVAFNRPTYSNTCTLKGLNINYDGLGTHIQLACGSDLSKYEAMVSITGDSVEVKTASNQDKILVTMTTNI